MFLNRVDHPFFSHEERLSFLTPHLSHFSISNRMPLHRTTKSSDFFSCFKNIFEPCSVGLIINASHLQLVLPCFYRTNNAAEQDADTALHWFVEDFWQSFNPHCQQSQLSTFKCVDVYVKSYLWFYYQTEENSASVKGPLTTPGIEFSTLSFSHVTAAQKSLALIFVHQIRMEVNTERSDTWGVWWRGEVSLWIMPPAVSFINSVIRCGAAQLIQTVNSYLSLFTGATSRPSCQYWQSARARMVWKLKVKRKETEF